MTAHPKRLAEDIFEKGAAAFLTDFPDLVAGRTEPVYPCPLCVPLRLFPRSALTTSIHRDRLTIEHVPPEAIGGHELLLTCRPCNNRAGSYLDADAQTHERQRLAMRGLGRHRISATWDAPAGRINGTLIVEDGRLAFQVPERINNPEHLARMRQSPAQVGDALPLRLEPFSELGMRLSWLRSAFLAFVVYRGFRFAFDPALEIVRRQIRDFETRIITMTAIENCERATAWSSPVLLECIAPEWRRGWGFLCGDRVTMLPKEGDVDFYQRLDNARCAGQDLRATFEVITRWPFPAGFGHLRAEIAPGHQAQPSSSS
jgi:hypothetical protein